jgi:hypothetical protein
MGSARKQGEINKRLERLEARLSKRSRVGIESVRAFLRGDPDPFLDELGPADIDKGSNSIRDFLFGRPFDDEPEDRCESS